MDSINSVSSNAGQVLNRYLAQPSSNVQVRSNTSGTGMSQTFQQALGAVAKVASTSIPGLAGVSPEYSSMIQAQVEMQEQMMKVTLITNVERTRHETKMAPVRNTRVA